MARISVVTPACLTFPPGNDFVLLVASKVELPREESDEVDVPGFDGAVWAPMAQLNRGVVRVIEPTGYKAKYVLLWDGGANAETPDKLIPKLF